MNKLPKITSFWLFHSVITLLTGGLVALFYHWQFADGFNYVLGGVTLIWFCMNIGIIVIKGYNDTGIFNRQ